MKLKKLNLLWVFDMEYLTYEQFVARYPDWFNWTSYDEYLEEYSLFMLDTYPALHPSEWF